MQDGDLGDAINPWAIALFRTIQATEPSGIVQETAFAKWLDQTSDREEARRDRVHGAAGITPDDDLDRAAPERGDRVLLHALLRRPGRDEALAGDARRLGDHHRRGDAARDLSHSTIRTGRAWEASSRSRWNAHSTFSTRLEPHWTSTVDLPCDESGTPR